MGYCTSNDILSAAAEQNITLYTDDDRSGAPDAGVIADAIASASARVDSYISGRYGTNLEPVPELVKSLTVDICIYKLSGRPGDAPATYRDNYNDAIRLLEQIAKGDADIPGITVSEDDVEAETAAAVVSRDKHYTGAGLEGF
jgi:phage gp36-like protein